MAKQRTPEQVADRLRTGSKVNAALSRAARAVGADETAGRTRRNAATLNVVARYIESGRCPCGQHSECWGCDA